MRITMGAQRWGLLLQGKSVEIITEYGLLRLEPVDNDDGFVIILEPNERLASRVSAAR